MSRISRAADIDRSLLKHLANHPHDLVRVVCDEMNVTRPAVLSRLNALAHKGYLRKSGTTRPTYHVGTNRRRAFHYRIAGLEEDVAWSREIRPFLSDVAPAVVEACQHGLTEMLNNVIDHSGSKTADVFVDINADGISIVISDNGIGIFRKISEHLHLPDEHLALLELSKGKLTTDPRHHSGEGVFFTARMFDTFQIVSAGLLFDLRDEPICHSLLQERLKKRGTSVLLEIAHNRKRKIGDVFRKYSSGPDDYSFAKTEIPLRMVRLGDESLLSRSQAKRVMDRADSFRTVVLDFSDIDMIGQAFADEIFRVFANAHPNVELIPTHAKPAVQQMINRVTSAPFDLSVVSKKERS
jgi:anti-sigma regulatory factor (Ser/Thr protein kinase)